LYYVNRDLTVFAPPLFVSNFVLFCKMIKLSKIKAMLYFCLILEGRWLDFDKTGDQKDFYH
jgi:hypothetical protein